jgi:iron complex outermembrane receptor protein
MDITLGARYTRDDREADKDFLSNLFTGPIVDPIQLSGDRTDSKFNPAVTINYTFSDVVNGYAKVATGYRAGGFNTRSTLQGFAAGFGPEDVISYEAGVKSQFNDNRSRLNAAVYYNDYDDLQVSQLRPGVVFTDILNAGNAVTQGLELEFSTLLTERLKLDMFYAYIDAEFKEYIDSDIDYADVYSVPYSPENTARIAVDYELGSLEHGTYSFNLDYQYQSKTFSGPRPADFNESYETLNARLNLSDTPVGDKGALRLGIWMKNMLDEEYTVLTSNLGSIASVYATPRTYGIDIIYEL